MKTHILLMSTTIAFLISGCSSRCRTSRSPWRKQDAQTITLTARWENESESYSHSSSHYEQHPLFDVFEQSYFNTHTIPDTITYYDDQKSLSKNTVNVLIENLLEEIRSNKKHFTNFIVLQRKNFNRNKKCGLLVLRFKDYPFVLKLFMETPQTFINPYCKGIEPTAFFFMAGGSNRHISGFTRIYNLEYIKEKLANMPHWSIHLPRKWFWAPQNNKYIELSSSNLASTTIKTLLPSTYAIIADAIEIKENHTFSRKKRNDLIMQLCTDLNFYIDPHSDNYIVTQDTTGHITIHLLDTEHFPSMVGIRDSVSFNSHVGWYFYLAKKCAMDTFFRLKNERDHTHYTNNALKLPQIVAKSINQAPLAQCGSIAS